VCRFSNPRASKRATADSGSFVTIAGLKVVIVMLVSPIINSGSSTDPLIVQQKVC
jgi:hypothetical protein